MVLDRAEPSRGPRRDRQDNIIVGDKYVLSWRECSLA